MVPLLGPVIEAITGAAIACLLQVLRATFEGKHPYTVIEL
jgi:hypothetical protein